MKKYLVICISSETGVCSVDPFNTEKEAQDFLNKDVENFYEEERDNNPNGEIIFHLEEDFTQLTNEKCSWNWTIHEINFN